MTNILPLVPDLAEQVSNIENNATNIKPLGRVYKFDFESNKFVIKDGKIVELTNDIEKIEQWIHLILLTYKDKFDVYKDTNFYCNINDYIGKKSIGKKGYWQSELMNEIRNSLTKHRYIKSVDEFEIMHMGIKWKISYKITLINGIIQKQEVL